MLAVVTLDSPSVGGQLGRGGPYSRNARATRSGWRRRERGQTGLRWDGRNFVLYHVRAAPACKETQLQLLFTAKSLDQKLAARPLLGHATAPGGVIHPAAGFIIVTSSNSDRPLDPTAVVSPLILALGLGASRHSIYVLCRRVRRLYSERSPDRHIRPAACLISSIRGWTTRMRRGQKPRIAPVPAVQPRLRRASGAAPGSATLSVPIRGSSAVSIRRAFRRRFGPSQVQNS